MGDSLRANAERILRDVQAVHSQMVAQIEHAERTPSHRPPAAGQLRPGTGRSGARAEVADQSAEDLPDVPEFIPRS
jgi:hypothetical protein